MLDKSTSMVISMTAGDIAVGMGKNKNKILTVRIETSSNERFTISFDAAKDIKLGDYIKSERAIL